MIVDLFCILFIIIGFWLGYRRGIIGTVFSVLSVLFGIIVAAKFSPAMTDLLNTLAGNGEQSSIFTLLAGIVASFALTMLLFRLLGRTIEGALESFNVNVINQVAGGILMVFMVVFLYSLIIAFSSRARLLKEPTKTESVTYVFLEKYPEVAWNVSRRFWPVFVEFYDYIIAVVDKIGHENADPAATPNPEQNGSDFFELPEDPR